MRDLGQPAKKQPQIPFGFAQGRLSTAPLAMKLREAPLRKTAFFVVQSFWDVSTIEPTKNASGLNRKPDAFF
jgi:hypothetical protein